MRNQQFIDRSLTEKEIKQRHKVTMAELDLFRFLNKVKQGFIWEAWDRHTVKGFRTSVSGFQIELRHMKNRDETLWSAVWTHGYHIDSKLNPEWYYINITDRLKRNRTKKVTDYAALPDDPAYASLKKLHNSLVLHQNSESYLEPETLGELNSLIKRCINSSPFRK